MTFIRIIKDKKKDKSQIIKHAAFTILLKNIIPEPDKSFKEILDYFDKEIKLFDPSVTSSALSNAHGDWYEWLLAIAAWNYCVENETANLALLTPNILQFTIATLYVEKLYKLIVDLREKVHLTSSVQLISSNPDFVIIDRTLVNKIIPKLEKISTIDESVIELIDNAYFKFIGHCEFDDIIGYMSVKSSLRPDRRLQIPHEGSLMKALYTHLQTREWIIDPKGIKYYAMSIEVKPADREALKTVATHSITTVHSKPQAAVDEVFQVDSMQQAQLAFQQILNA
jgi:hypothetical protein